MREIRWDAPFWAGLMVVFFALGALGCIGIAAAESGQPVSAEIVSPDFAALTADAQTR